MSGGMPELGSKISLISKADIRYEGRLFTVNPEECTIALANVRSFGTEDRETHCPIACQNQIYDYILFRGSDIKDIRVVNSVPIPNDPAIMQMHLPPNQMVQPNYPPQGFPLQSMNHMGGPPMNQFNPYGHGHNQMGNMSGLQQGSLQGVQKKQPTSVLDLIGGGSRSTTPVSLVSRKSPTADMGVQTNQSNAGGQNREKKSGNQMQNQQRNNNNNTNNNQRERHDSGKADNNNYNNQNDKFKQNNNLQNNHRSNNQSNQNNRGWINRGNNMQMRGNRSRGRGGIPQQTQGYRQGGGDNNSKSGNNRPKNTLKFENDFDFEQANTKFEEIRSQLAKLKVAGEEVVKPEPVVTMNGEVDKKDDSGNETGAGEHEQEDEEVCYDKTKSFFDTISCEAVERSKGKTQRTDWRQERKINSETFGVSSTRRGGFRGRGGFFNRGPNMNFRGNYRGNFRGGRNNNVNNNNNNTRNNVHSSGNMGQRNQQPQQQQPQQPPAQVVAGK